VAGAARLRVSPGEVRNVAEVGEHCAALTRVHEHRRGFEVAVDAPRGVQVRERRQALLRDAADCVVREPLASVAERAVELEQRAARDELHHDPEELGGGIS